MRAFNLFILLFFSFFSSGCFYVRVLIMVTPEKKVLEKVEIGKFQVKYTSYTPWAGAPWYEYKLQKKIIGIPYTISKTNTWWGNNLDSTCFVSFSKRNKEIIFNKCENKMLKKPKSDH